MSEKKTNLEMDCFSDNFPERGGNYFSLAKKKELERKAQEEEKLNAERTRAYTRGYYDAANDSTVRDDDYSWRKEYQ